MADHQTVWFSFQLRNTTPEKIAALLDRVRPDH